MTKRVVITGATSSLGTALCEKCIQQNTEVLALIQPGSVNRKRIPQSPLIEVMEIGLEEYSDVKDRVFNKTYDTFFHLAWGATQGDAARGKIVPQAKNIEFSLSAVELANNLGCKTFIGAGSQAEYGRTEETLTENTECHPETPYGIAKLCAGQLTRLACKQYGIKHIWPRILSAYGPNCQPQTIINYTITELLNGRTPSLSGGDQVWDFIYTGDVAEALLQLDMKGHDGDIYVIGSGKSQPLKDYLFTVRDIVAPNGKLGLGEKPYSENSVMHLACDITKLKTDTGYEPHTSFEEGISLTKAWIEKGIL